MKGLFTQGVAVLFATAPQVSELGALLGDYATTESNSESGWPMGGPGLTIPYRPEVNGTCIVDICDRVWPDDMGDPKTSPELFGAWSMGFFGPATFPGGLARAAAQSQPWPAAKEVVPRHQAFVRLRITYARGAGPNAKVAPSDYNAVDEFTWLTRLTRRLLDHPGALCFFNPGGEVLRDAKGVDAALQRAKDGGFPPLNLAVNIRFWTFDERWKVADTVGFSLLDLPDHEVAFQPRNHSGNEIAYFPFNIALYLLEKKDAAAIKSGETVDGPGGKWRAQERSKPVMSPPRAILQWTRNDDPPLPAPLRQ